MRCRSEPLTRRAPLPIHGNGMACISVAKARRRGRLEVGVVIAARDDGRRPGAGGSVLFSRLERLAWRSQARGATAGTERSR